MSKRRIPSGRYAMLLGLMAALIASHIVVEARGGNPVGPHSTRAGGVLQQSHAYHRGQYAPLKDVPRYSYGFPVPSYRWGWFGAKRYYPRSFSHRGHTGDYWQWAYRRGY